MATIRLLKANEIEARVQVVGNNGFSLLLYKDARVDMSILDETFGIFGWKRKHEIIGDRLYCTISIYDKENGMWIDKQDVGTESYTEKEKGQASDSFKRAAFNVGIGRELYTAPFIWINNEGDVANSNGKLSVKTRCKVSEIGYNENREIDHLTITDDKGKIRYQLGQKSTNANTKTNTSKADASQGKRAELLSNILKIAESREISPEMLTGLIKEDFNKENSTQLTMQELYALKRKIEG